MASILIVDDEKNTRQGLKTALSLDYDVACVANVEEAKQLLEVESFDLILTDLRMGTQSGMDLLEYIRVKNLHTASIMMTAYGNIATAVEAMRKGADDFITKPIDLDTLYMLIEKTLKARKKNVQTDSSNATISNIPSSKKVGSPNKKFKLISQSKAFCDLLKQADKVAQSKATVLLTGETGTGKELLAHYIHEKSKRASEPFVVVHCSAIPTNLLESELFGHEKGSFTGAIQKKIGKFEAADKGSVFLDEIGEIDAQAQVKLLRFLENKTFERIGNHNSISVDTRLICATNRELKEMVKADTFREDLFYRLNVVQLHIPPLRERREDIQALLEYYIDYFAKENSLPSLKISKEALVILLNYNWAGNIRELRNFCENKVVMQSSDTITCDDLDGRFLNCSIAELDGGDKSLSKKDNEAELIQKALEMSAGNKTKAAQILGISRRTLHRKLAGDNQE